MAKKIIFENSYLLSTIMCFDGCGMSLQNSLNNKLEELKKQHLLPHDAQIIINAEPRTLGIHQILISIESEQDDFTLGEGGHGVRVDQFKQHLKANFTLIDEDQSGDKLLKHNWLNIATNLMTVLVTVALSMFFPPSLPLTASLVVLTFTTTAFTARSYFGDFFSNLRNKNFATMATPITLGWLLSLSHTLYHSITMPLTSSFSMIFMNFHMPIMLVTVLNFMDVIKELVMNKVQTMQLRGLKTLFPQMAEDYACYQLSLTEQEKLAQLLEEADGDAQALNYCQSLIASPFLKQKRHLLKKGMLITVKPHECFPVDGIILQGPSLVDTSHITGETRQEKQAGDFVPAGAINLNQEIFFYATEDCYRSTINKLLFVSNRRREEEIVPPPKSTKFIYLYLSLILFSLVASLLIPYALGILTISLLLQNVTGILFSICPCTIAIGHELPKLLSIYQLGQRGIFLRDENLDKRFDDIETFVFDKTGTLTTGDSQVDSCEGLSAALWQRIYLLEKEYGADHPIAKAICTHYQETYDVSAIMMNDINEFSFDANHRGLSATVQGTAIHLGSLDYMLEKEIDLKEKKLSFLSESKLVQGYTPVYVAEGKEYKGIVFIRHEVRKALLEDLKDLKKRGKQIIMLTGDSQVAATHFNQQIDNLFAEDEIYAHQTPQDKDLKLQDPKLGDLRKVCFVGDGLNDGLCARRVTDNGGISCSITNTDKSAYFTDIRFNGSLHYFFARKQLNSLLDTIIWQNQLILGSSSFVFLAFIMGFSIAGIAVSPLIPMLTMGLTTLFCVLNSYRAKHSVDNLFVKNDRPEVVKENQGLPNYAPSPNLEAARPRSFLEKRSDKKLAGDFNNNDFVERISIKEGGSSYGF